LAWQRERERGYHRALRSSIRDINAMDQEEFVRIIGPVFEHSPWIAEQTWASRPFQCVKQLHEALCATVAGAPQEKQEALIRTHPDLVGRAVLTAESQGEQAAAGLTNLTPEEVATFDQYNRAYRERFGFPFVICARLNKKEAILRVFPERLKNSREQEISTALGEIYKIAQLRLADLVEEAEK
jgi:2-oxo-4-hydroxy-4-carboxy-5-ureidoimidazoline decarboxylase